MNSYELAVVVKPDLTEDAFNIAFDELKNLIEKAGGAVEKVEQWDKKKLAYEIQKFHEGFYNFIFFSATPNVSLELESKLRINENILRYLIVRHEK